MYIRYAADKLFPIRIESVHVCLSTAYGLELATYNESQALAKLEAQTCHRLPDCLDPGRNLEELWLQFVVARSHAAI